LKQTKYTMKKILLFVAFIIFSAGANATGELKPLAQKIANRKMQHVHVSEHSLFTVDPGSSNKAAVYGNAVSDGVILQTDPVAIRELINTKPENIQLNIPGKNGSKMELELFRVDIFTPDFGIVTSSGENISSGGVHYRGIIKGDDKSLAAISIFDNEVMGLVSTPMSGNFILGKLKGDADNEHIFYNDRNLPPPANLECMTSEDGISYSASQLEKPLQISTNCIRIYWELNYDIYLDKGNITNATNYATGLFNESATLYANDGIPVELSQVFVWNTASPYTGTNPGALLGQFQSYRNSFNGDLGHLLGMVGGGGVAAGFNGLCAVDRDNSQCFSMVDGTFQNVPVYSWSVEVVTHEQGHLMGSRHTHACVWNGNNTAIDGCGPSAGYPYEGGCSNAPIPAGGGTIMSYCHLIPTGINFTNGFGPQPAAVILNNYNNASCLSACTGGSFCASSAYTTTINVGTTTADLIWESVAGAASYNIQYRLVGNIAWSTDTSQDTIYNAIGLTPGADYEWQVQTNCGANTSQFTSSTFFITIPLSCDAPTLRLTTNISAFSVNFSWNSVPGATSYNIQYRVVGAVGWSTASTVDTFYHVTGLTANTDYEWEVQTLCVGGGVSGFSQVSLFTTLELGAVRTITLQPDAECGKDAVMGDNIPLGYYNQNFGDGPEFDAMAWTAGGGNSNLRSLLQFDLTEIPEGSSVQSAYLSLYWNPTSVNTGHSNLVGTNEAVLSKVDAPWDEHLVTWVSQPATTLVNEVALPSSTSNTQDYLNIDVTAMVQDFVNSPQTNYGMLFKEVNETPYHSLIFCTSDHADPTKRPKLEVTFSPNNQECKHYQYSNCMGMDAVIGNSVAAGYDTTNFADGPEFDAMAWTYSGSASALRSMIYWDLSEIPINAIVDTAYFSLFWNPTSVNTGHSSMSGPNDAYLLKITSSWNENSVTWNTQPTTTTVDQVYLSQSTSSTQDYLDMNVTSFVQDWVTNPSSNNGIMFMLATEIQYRSLVFCTSDHADPAKHPRLDICFHLPTDIVDDKHQELHVYEDFNRQELHVVSNENFPAQSILTIYSVNGQLLRSFENLSGTHFVVGKDNLSPGVYFYRLDLGDHSENGKIIFR
jgi:hypothetical protein